MLEVQYSFNIQRIVLGKIVMSQIITRKFGLNTDDINKVQKIFLKFRDFENLIITRLLSYADDPDFIDQFKRKAKIGYKIAYDYFVRQEAM